MNENKTVNVHITYILQISAKESLHNVAYYKGTINNMDPKAEKNKTNLNWVFIKNIEIHYKLNGAAISKKNHLSYILLVLYICKTT